MTASVTTCPKCSRAIYAEWLFCRGCGLPNAAHVGTFEEMPAPPVAVPAVLSTPPAAVLSPPPPPAPDLQPAPSLDALAREAVAAAQAPPPPPPPPPVLQPPPALMPAPPAPPEQRLPEQQVVLPQPVVWQAAATIVPATVTSHRPLANLSASRFVGTTSKATLQVVAMVLVVAALATYGLVTRSHLNSTRVTLAATESHLETTTATLSSTKDTLDTTKAEVASLQTDKSKLQQDLKDANSDLVATKSTLVGAQDTVSQQESHIRDLKTCLDGVAGALVDLANGYLQSALGQLNAVSSACKRADSNI